MRGILRGIVWITGGLFAVVLIAVVVFGLAIWTNRDWPKNRLPAQLTFTEVINASSAQGGFLEGCDYAEYRLAPETTMGIRRQGLRFFDNVSQPPSQKRNPFGSWRETPIPETRDLVALGAEGGCQDDAANKNDGPTIRLRLDQSGSFYSYTENREGLIVVDAKQGVIVYMYFG